MQIPNSGLASERLAALGQHHVAAFRQQPETEPLVAAFKGTLDELLAASREREAALRAPVPR